MFSLLCGEYWSIRLSIKIIVSGRPAGWLKKVRLETFFFIFAKKKFVSPKIDNIFMGKKNKVEKK